MAATTLRGSGFYPKIPAVYGGGKALTTRTTLVLAYFCGFQNQDKTDIRKTKK